MNIAIPHYSSMQKVISNVILYLLCYFRQRSESNLERIADGFIYNLRKLKDQANDYAKDMTFKDWQKAAANVGKANIKIVFSGKIV